MISRALGGHCHTHAVQAVQQLGARLHVEPVPWMSGEVRIVYAINESPPSWDRACGPAFARLLAGLLELGLGLGRGGGAVGEPEGLGHVHHRVDETVPGPNSTAESCSPIKQPSRHCSHRRSGRRDHAVANRSTAGGCGGCRQRVCLPQGPCARARRCWVPTVH